MKILITNDDGIQSPGILSLRDILSRDHDVWVMAPDGDRSGYSHSITLKEPVKIKQKEPRLFSCSGTPVDCIVYGQGGYLEEEFDVILSGINIGPNMGTDILYSGTAAAARQGALKNTPSIAISMNKFVPPFDFDSISEYISTSLEKLVSLWEEGCFLNMNFPEKMDVTSEMKWCRPARRIYKDEVVMFQSPRDEGTYCFLKGNLIQSENEEGSDVKAVQSGHVSISAISLAPSIVPHIGKLSEKAGSVC
jgi:5'-nucleotidase